MRELTFAPKMMGQLLYPGGAPVQPDTVSFCDNNAVELFLKTQDKKLDEDELQFLLDFVVYYVNAPLWQITSSVNTEFLEFIKQADDLKTQTALKVYVFDLLDFGIDIF